MDPISIALGLAKFVPAVTSWLGHDKAASDIVKIAETITGRTGEDALTVINTDPAAALEFKKAVMADKHRLDELYLQDKASARNMYQVHHDQTDRISDRIMKWNLWMIFALVILNGVAVYFLKTEAAVLATVSNILGIVIKSLLDERKEVTGFYFGSSVGSKIKDNPGYRKDHP